MTGLKGRNILAQARALFAAAWVRSTREYSRALKGRDKPV